MKVRLTSAAFGTTVLYMKVYEIEHTKMQMEFKNLIIMGALLLTSVVKIKADA